MLNPQDIQEKVFAKAVFGGYDMAGVDDFLEEVYSDYNALYRDNAVLKSKMKLLVEKVEEYRVTEDSMRLTLVAARKVGDDMAAEAKAKCDDILAEAKLSRDNIIRSAEDEAAAIIADARKQAEAILAEAKVQASQPQAEAAPAPVPSASAQDAWNKALDYIALARRVAQRQLEMLDELESAAGIVEAAAMVADTADAPAETEAEVSSEEPEATDSEVTEDTVLFTPPAEE